jgi:allantoinase
MALSIHPWKLGQPHRIPQIERVLAHNTAPKGFWSAGAGDICSAWQAASA